jgi:hypothetical protein
MKKTTIIIIVISVLAVISAIFYKMLKAAKEKVHAKQNYVIALRHAAGQIYFGIPPSIEESSSGHRPDSPSGNGSGTGTILLLKSTATEGDATIFQMWKREYEEGKWTAEGIEEFKAEVLGGHIAYVLNPDRGENLIIKYLLKHL